jgi:hypothetical protein
MPDPVPAPAPVPLDVAKFLEKLEANVSVTSDIGAVANAITEICKTLQTPEGQAGLKAWRENTAAFNGTLIKAWGGFTAWITGLNKPK